MAPGSQNGFDNSGRKGAINWTFVAVDEDGALTHPNIDRTLRVIRHITALLSGRIEVSFVACFSAFICVLVPLCTELRIVWIGIADHGCGGTRAGTS